MSAQRLRDAAAECRRRPGQITHEDDLQQALADWLDQTAVEWDVWGEHDRNIDKALIVADRILGPLAEFERPASD